MSTWHHFEYRAERSYAKRCPSIKIRSTGAGPAPLDNACVDHCTVNLIVVLVTDFNGDARAVVVLSRYQLFMSCFGTLVSWLTFSSNRDL